MPNPADTNPATASTETPVDAVAAPASPAPSTPASPDAGSQPAGGPESSAAQDAPADGAGEDATDTSNQPATKPEDWRDARIRKLTAKLRESESSKKDTPAADTAPAEAQIERRANELAEQKAQWTAFNNACAGAAEAGRTTYGSSEFDTQVKELSKLNGEGTDPEAQARYNTFLLAALDTGEAPKLIYHLGQNLNEAARIMALPPIKMAIELTRLAAKDPAPGSKAPKPITPIGSRGASHVSIDPTDTERADNLSTAEWMKRREAQISAAHKRN